MKNNIKQLRKQAGLRQEDMANQLGVTPQTIIAIENDKYNPHPGTGHENSRLLNQKCRGYLLSGLKISSVKTIISSSPTSPD